MKKIPGKATAGPSRLPTNTSILVCPNDSFKVVSENDPLELVSEISLTFAAVKPADLRIPEASYITIKAIVEAKANKGSSKPSCSPTPAAVPVTKAE